MQWCCAAWCSQLSHSHSLGRRYRQRCSDGAALPGALRHLGPQAQCNLPLFILPAGAIARNAVMVSCCAVLSSVSACRAIVSCQYSSFRRALPPAMQVMVLRCPALSAISARRPSATCHSSSFQHYCQRRSDGAVLPGALSHLGQQAQCQLPISILPAGAIAKM